MLSWEKLVTDIFYATTSSQSMVQGLLSRIGGFSKVLPQITTDFNSLSTNYSIVNIYQGGDPGLVSGGGLVVSTVVFAHQTLGYSHHSEIGQEFNAHVLTRQRFANSYSFTTDRVYDNNIERHGKHEELCRFDRTDDQFFTVLKVIKTGSLPFPS